MAGTDPGTRSPGGLLLFYNRSADQHVCAVRYINGVDIEAVSACRTDANELANVLKGVMYGNNYINGWGIRLPDGSTGYQENFAAPIEGVATGGARSSSHTLTLSGNGVPTGVGSAKGRTRLVWFDDGILGIAAGTKSAPNGTFAPMLALATLLHTNLRYFADFYGQKAEPKTYFTVQYNARAQRKLGT